jgi:hypothetical protein
VSFLPLNTSPIAIQSFSVGSWPPCEHITFGTDEGSGDRLSSILSSDDDRRGPVILWTVTHKIEHTGGQGTGLRAQL